MFNRIIKKLPAFLLILLITTYTVYFSIFTIFRYQKLYAHYFDLGIMDQTVHNSYMSIKTLDPSRFLEMTDPHDTAKQLKRMSVHNDPLLGLLAPFYFIHDGPETLLVIQSFVVALGAIFIFLITKEVFSKSAYDDWLALLFSFIFLLYPPMQKSNIFEFHAVTLSTTIFLAIYYFWLKKKYAAAGIFVFLVLLTKEQVGLTLAFLGIYILLHHFRKQIVHMFSILWRYKRNVVVGLKQAIEYKINFLTKDFFNIVKTSRNARFGVILILSGIIWTILSMTVIIPYFRGTEHFGAKYYGHIAENPVKIILYIFRPQTWDYLVELLTPVSFLSIFSPLHFLIALPELMVNILSNNAHMRNTYFHYESVITPFTFISAIYGLRRIFNYELRITKWELSSTYKNILLVGIILTTAIFSAYRYGPLPGAREFDRYPWNPAPELYSDVIKWKEYLKDEQIKVSTTGKIAPHFTSRQYFYDFSWKYVYADYVILDSWDAVYGYLQNNSKPSYQKIQQDNNFERIYNNNGIEVYKKITKD